MKKTMCIAVWIFLAVALQHADADFYRYVDEHGNVLYTDDLSKVPANQRDKTQAYEESQGPSPSATSQTAPTETKKEPSQADVTALEKEREKIQTQEKELNDEYGSLMKERSDLDEEKQNALTPAQIKAYNQKIVDFNTRIQAYEAKRSVYADQVKSFNESLKSGPQESPNK